MVLPMCYKLEQNTGLIRGFLRGSLASKAEVTVSVAAGTEEELDAKVVELDEALAAVDDKAADMEGVNDGQCDAIEDANAILEALVQRLEAAGLEVPPEVNGAIAALGAELEDRRAGPLELP